MRYLVSGMTATLRRVLSSEPGAADHLGGLTSPGATLQRTLLALGLPWAADNGAFSGFDPAAFRRLLRAVAGTPRCLFVVCPDAVADAAATLALFDEWEAEVRACGQPVAFVGQDGQESLPVPWGRFGAYFVGGSTAWKLGRESRRLVREAKARGLWVHMGRVNSYRRMRVAHAWGCDSVDGTSVSRWGNRYIARYARYLRALDAQRLLFD